MIEIKVEYKLDIAEQIKKNIPKLLDEIEKTGLEYAKMFEYAHYDDGESTNDALVFSKQGEKSVTITAEGESVLFIEYGAGVFYNGTEPHPDRPPDVLGIGEYGKGHGKRRKWYFKDERGIIHPTRGTKAVMPMYQAKKSIRQLIEEKGTEILTK